MAPFDTLMSPVHTHLYRYNYAVESLAQNSSNKKHPHRIFKRLDGKPVSETIMSKRNRGHWKYVNGANLLIETVDRNDSGWYTCFGRDDENEVSAKASVTVICK